MWAESERYAPGCQVSWWAMSYAVWRNEALYHMPEDHKVDVLGMQHRDRWSISCVLTIHRPQLLCRNAQTANWYLNLNVLGYRYKKQGLCPCSQNEKYYRCCIYIGILPCLLIGCLFPCVLPDMGGMGGWSKQSLCSFSEMLFDDVLFHNFWKWIMTFSIGVNTRQIFYWKDEVSQISVRIWYVRANMCHVSQGY